MDELEVYAAINDSAEKIARLERMVFLMLSIMNGTIFVGGEACDTFGDQLAELWRLQREQELEKLAGMERVHQGGETEGGRRRVR